MLELSPRLPEKDGPRSCKPKDGTDSTRASTHYGQDRFHTLSLSSLPSKRQWEHSTQMSSPNLVILTARTNSSQLLSWQDTGQVSSALLCPTPLTLWFQLWTREVELLAPFMERSASRVSGTVSVLVSLWLVLSLVFNGGSTIPLRLHAVSKLQASELLFKFEVTKDIYAGALFILLVEASLQKVALFKNTQTLFYSFKMITLLKY